MTVWHATWQFDGHIKMLILLRDSLIRHIKMLILHDSLTHNKFDIRHIKMLILLRDSLTRHIKMLILQDSLTRHIKMLILHDSLTRHIKMLILHDSLTQHIKVLYGFTEPWQTASFQTTWDNGREITHTYSASANFRKSHNFFFIHLYIFFPSFFFVLQQYNSPMNHTETSGELSKISLTPALDECHQVFKPLHIFKF